MKIQISISNQIESRLRQQADAVGKDLPTFVVEALGEKLTDYEESAAMARSADCATERWVTAFQEWDAN